MDDKLFIRSEDGQTLYEGPLGENADNIKLLFVMKEPNGEELNCFWLKDILKGNESGGTRYINVLNIYIDKLFGRKVKITSKGDSILNNIAFINLFPFFGESSVRLKQGYSSLIESSVWEDVEKAELKQQITKTDKEKTILRNRLEIIKAALNNGAIVIAHFEIVNMLQRFDENIVRISPKVDGKDHHIAAYNYKGHKQIFSVQHPKSTQLTDVELYKLFNNI